MTKAWASAVVVLALAAPAGAVEAPITSVTVFSDRARVTRTAAVALSGRQQVDLPLLGERVDGSSIRLDSRNAEVQTVDLRWVVGDEAFPLTEAREVLAALEAVDGDIVRARRDRNLHAGFDLMRLLEPAVPGLNAPRPAARLSAAGWGRVTAFSRDWTEKQQARVRELDERLRDLGVKRAELAQRAQRLGAERRRGGWRVSATVVGSGKAALDLSYMVSGARWYPSYDILLDPATQQVQVAFAGLVSQETGEDWDQALLTLSTAVPATTSAFPTVFTWKIGERERFIPKPRPYAEPVPPPPPAAPVARAATDDVGQLRQRLMARAAGPPEGGDAAKTDEALAGLERKVRRHQAADVDADGVEDSEVDGGIEGGVAGRVVGTVYGGAAGAVGRPAPAAPPPPPARPRRAARAEAPAPAPQAAPAAREESVELESLAPGSHTVDATPTSVRASAAYEKAVVSTVAIGIGPPPGYQPPFVSSDLPAALAGGYDLTYKAAAPDTIASGKGARRVALFSRSFPVTVERRVFPDLQPEAAFLVAELKNPTGQPLPGGQAKLFVGSDPAGVAQLATVAAGESFTLPLGLDRGIKPVRNVKVVTTVSGLISKQETNEYTVTIEVTNPTRSPLRLRVVDQVPVSDDKDVNIKLQRTSPAVTAHDEVTGKLEWRLTVPATAKTTVSFVYTLERPKGYQLRQ
jgi:hypothetical protein